MSRQNTFKVIPRYNGEASAQPARPMTSKEVRKAHKASTKGPTMTRAERIKFERAEQERIRKELDKEKAASKSRAARERKKEKESAEREAKKKMGMPTVNVRPSQDTIARFVRGNGGNKRNSSGCVVAPVTEPTIAEEESRDNTPTALNDLDGIVEADCEESIKQATEADELQAAKAKAKEIAASPNDETAPNSEPTDSLAEAGISNDDLDLILDDDIDLAEFDTIDPTLSIDAKSQTPKVPSQRSQSNAQFTKSPPKERTPKKSLHSPIQQPRQSPAESLSKSPSPFAPPPSTQAILFNFDSFFPSASQQALELEDMSPQLSAPKIKYVPSPLQPQPQPKTPSNEPKRFFTSSGSTEQLSLALHRSRRTAALEELHQKERERREAGLLLRQSKRQCIQPTPEQSNIDDIEKENIPPMGDSQETEYGGDWIDDAAIDIAF